MSPPLRLRRDRVGAAIRVCSPAGSSPSSWSSRASSPTVVMIASRLPGDLVDILARRVFGSSTSPRWKSALCLKESVNVSSSSEDGDASASSDATGMAASLTAGSTLRVQASWTCSKGPQPVGGRLGGPGLFVGRCRARRGRGNGRGPHDSAAGAPACTRIQHLDPMDKRLAGQIGVWPGHLDERELERQPRIAPCRSSSMTTASRSTSRTRRWVPEAGSPARAAGRATPR